MLTISTTLPNVQPRTMSALYPGVITYVHVKNNIGHLLWRTDKDKFARQQQFGPAVACYSAPRRSWLTLDHDRLSTRQVEALLTGVTLCMLGDDCERHHG